MPALVAHLFSAASRPTTAGRAEAVVTHDRRRMFKMLDHVFCALSAALLQKVWHCSNSSVSVRFCKSPQLLIGLSASVVVNIPAYDMGKCDRTPRDADGIHRC